LCSNSEASGFYQLSLKRSPLEGIAGRRESGEGEVGLIEVAFDLGQAGSVHTDDDAGMFIVYLYSIMYIIY